MAGAGLSVGRLRALLGADAAIADAEGAFRVAPRTETACALLLRSASGAGWRVRLEGGRSWMPPDAPADLILSTSGLDEVRNVSGADLVGTAGAGVPLGDLRDALADAGTWVAIDPPGDDRRTLGSALATGTSGPQRTGFGPIRDQLLGLTLVTGDGRVVRAGGRVVKNVAGFDLTRLAAGSFGLFGLITTVHLRLRAVPRADVTLAADGRRDALLEAARALLAAGAAPDALELLSPGAAGRPTWRLAVRLFGTDAEVRARRDGARAACPVPLDDADGAMWRDAAARATDAPLTLRLGAVPTALETALDLVAHHLDEAVSGWMSVSVLPGAVRWSGSASPEHLRLFRRAAAEREMPVTLERAPYAVRQQVGVFGAYREGAARLVEGLRARFDPAGVLV